MCQDRSGTDTPEVMLTLSPTLVQFFRLSLPVPSPQPELILLHSPLHALQTDRQDPP